MRAVIELKKDVDPERTLRLLYRYSDMQTTFGVNMVAIADGKPRQLGLKDALYYFIRHQEDVVRRRTQFDLDKARAREHILQGLIIAVDQLDRVIALIRASKNPKAAREGLMKEFNLTEIQAQAILDMRLQRLTNLEILELRREYKEIEALIGKLEGILKSEKKAAKGNQGRASRHRRQVRRRPAHPVHTPRCGTARRRGGSARARSHHGNTDARRLLQAYAAQAV